MSVIILNTGLELVNGIKSNKIPIAQLEMKLTLKETISKPLLRTVFKGKDEVAFTFITSIVKRFSDSFGFSTKKTKSEIDMLVVDTLEHFTYESIEDVILFFKMARSGNFGTTNRGIDSNLIFGEWFPKYMDLKADMREKEQDRENHKNSTDSRGCSYDEVLKLYNKDANNKKISFEGRVKIYIEKITENMDSEMLENTIYDWERCQDRKKYVRLLKQKRRTIK